MTATFRYSLVACARWEADAIGEWLSYHRAIGFEHAFLYCNDDNPDALYEKVLPFRDFVTFRHYPFVGQQYLMYRHFLRHQRHRTEWFIFLDIDEFLYLGPHRDIAEAMSGRSDACDSIYFNWVFFGANGHRTRPDGVLRHLTRRGPDVDAHTKTMTRSNAVHVDQLDPFVHHSVHHHWPAEIVPFRKINILGHRMDEYWDDFPRSAESYLARPEHRQEILAGPCIFHYFMKSEQDFRRRRERSNAADFAGQANWGRMADDGTAADLLAHLNQVEDDRLARFWTDHLSQAPRLLDVASEWPNVALGKATDQSSVSAFSNRSTTRDDAAGAVNGRITGHYGFHTEDEDRPWWSVDLGADHRIYLLLVYNRFDNEPVAARFREFDVQISDDGSRWETLRAVRGDRIWGGMDGEPYRLELDLPIVTRRVRIILADRGILHLDQVAIYGEPVVRKC